VEAEGAGGGDIAEHRGAGPIQFVRGGARPLRDERRRQGVGVPRDRIDEPREPDQEEAEQRQGGEGRGTRRPPAQGGGRPGGGHGITHAGIMPERAVATGAGV